MSERFVEVLPLVQLAAGQQHVYQHRLDRILICHTHEGELYAMLDLCPHARQPLAGGRMEGASVFCPKHGARFDLATGCPMNAVSKKPITLLAVRVVEGQIQVALPNA